MTTVRERVSGKPATVMYLDDRFNPVAKADAKMVRVLWDDGNSAWLVPRKKDDTDELQRAPGDAAD